MKPLVSIIIPTYNQSEFLAEAIESVVGQTYQPIELIVVDDGSTDQTPMVIEKYPGRLVAMHQQNSGAAAARNLGASKAKGDYLVFLDGDDKLDPNYLPEAVKLLEEHPEAGFCYPSVSYFGEMAGMMDVGEFDRDRLLIGNYIVIGALLRTEVFRQSPGFPDWPGGYEDWAFWLGLVKTGVTGIWLPKPYYLWRRRRGTRNDITRQQGHRFRRQILSKLGLYQHFLWLRFRGIDLPISLTPADQAIDLSVIIPNWNGRKLLGACLDSLRRQTQTGLEVIVVENGSVDGSSQFIKENYPEVRLLEQEVNLGFAGGVNRGIRQARGQRIGLLNNDAVVEPNWAEEMIRGLKEADIIQSKILQSDDHTKIDTTGDFMSKWGLPYPRGRNQTDNSEPKTISPIFSACGGSVVYRRRVFETVGLFDEAFFAYLEDVDLSFRARLAGFKVAINPLAITYHHVGATAKQMGSFPRYHYIKNSFYLFYKNFPASVFIRTLPRFCLVQMLMFVSALKNGVPQVALKAYLKGLVRLPKLIRQRHRIQSSRKISPHQVADWLTDYDSMVAEFVGKFHR